MSTAPQTDQTRGFGLATVGTVVPAVLVLTLFVLYVVRVPSAKKTFDEFGLTLPWLTLSVIRVSNWVAEYWWSLGPVLLILGIGHFGLTAALGAHHRFAAMLWVVGVALFLAALVGLTVFAIELPMMKLKAGLAR